MCAQCTTIPLYSAIDIGKNVHWFGGYEGPECRPCKEPVSVHSTRRGYVEYCMWLHTQIASGRYGPILVGIEPTSVYHESWAYALDRDFGQQIDLRFVNPYQTKTRRKLAVNGRGRKSDPLDVYAIACCLRDGLSHPVRLLQHVDLRFGAWAAAFRRTYTQKQRLQGAILSQLDRVWPGMLVSTKGFAQAHPEMAVPEPLVSTCFLDRKIVQILIEFAPNPHQWLKWSSADIQDFFHDHNMSCGPVTAQRVYNVVHNSMLLPMSITEDLTAYLRRDWERYQSLVEEVGQLRHQVDPLVPGSSAAVLTTIPGVNSFLAATFLAYVGDIGRFQHADQIWSAAGFDPLQYASGDSSRRGKISRRGNPGMRDVLFTIGLNTIPTCPAIGRARQRALQHGKGKVGAIIHAAHLAMRMCFCMVRDQTPYDPQRMR